MSFTIERYPTHLIDVFALHDGSRVVVRPVLPQDAALEQAMVRALSPAARYQRFFAPIRELSPQWLARFTQIDYRQHQALIASTFIEGTEVAVGEARYVVDDSSRSAEFAVVVAEAWQRRGLARRLLEALTRSARIDGVAELVGDVLVANLPMLGLARSLGFRIKRHPGDANLMQVTLAVQAGHAVCADRAPAAAPAFHSAAPHATGASY